MALLMDFTSAIPPSNGRNGGGISAFDNTEPAPEFSPLPPGIYVARVLRGEYCSTRAGADAYRLRFEVTEGPHAGRTAIRTWTFGPKALPYTKRDLAPFGLTTSAALLSPFPEPGREYLVRLVVVLQRGDDGIERNDIKKIDLIRVVESPAAAFMLPGVPGDAGDAGDDSARTKSPPPVWEDTERFFALMTARGWDWSRVLSWLKVDPTAGFYAVPADLRRRAAEHLERLPVEGPK
jgi:hypothetical protein